MGNPSHSALCSRCILCNVQPSISLTYNTLDYTRSTCLIRKVQQTHEPRVRHYFIDHCNVQYSISLAYNTLDNTRSTCSMCNVQQTHLSLGYVTRPQTNATCNPQHLRRTFRSTIRSTCSIRNVHNTFNTLNTQCSANALGVWAEQAGHAFHHRRMHPSPAAAAHWYLLEPSSVELQNDHLE